LSNMMDGVLFRNAFINGANNLCNNKTNVDDLNVFPVPDGDTGTNMSLTISAASRDVLACDADSVSVAADAAASASLRGARGNSGVILSQLLRGFSKGVAKKDTVSITDIAAAFKSASDTAYKAVMKPTEGTILTVARLTAEYAVEIASDEMDIVEFGEKIVAKANEALDLTPELLPVLKQAGVVDAGGKGLVVVLEGILEYLKGNTIEASEPQKAASSPQKNFMDIDTANIKFMYCTEFLIEKKSKNYSVQAFRAAIEPKGDCMLVIEDDDIVKVHIHTNRPGFVLEQAVKIGELTNLKIDNMKYQHNEILTEAEEEEKPSEPAKKYGFVSVAAGDGMKEIFENIGVDFVVSGGQSMNPSTDDILKAVEAVNAENVFVMPNNKNIILAAEQAVELASKNVIVIPTKTIPQGITAILTFDENSSAEDNAENMKEAIATVKTGQVTFAARTTDVDDMHITEGDIMGMVEGKIVELGKDPSAVALKIAEEMADDYSAVISIYYGEDVKETDAANLEADLRIKFPMCDVLLNKGGQPLYYYIISVE